MWELKLGETEAVTNASLPKSWCLGQGDPYSHPLDVVLRLLLNEVDAFQHVGDVVNPPLLHFEHLCCLVQIQDPIR